MNEVDDITDWKTFSDLFVGKTIKSVEPNGNGSTMINFEFTDGTEAFIWGSELLGTDIGDEQFYLPC